MLEVLLQDPALGWIEFEWKLALTIEEVVESSLHFGPVRVVVADEDTPRPDHGPPFTKIRRDGMVVMAAIDMDYINRDLVVSQDMCGVDGVQRQGEDIVLQGPPRCWPRTCGRGQDSHC
jgi:hypothetical protein